MDSKELHSLLRKQPFQPIRLCLSDGKSYDIVHPDFVYVDRSTLHLGILGPAGVEEPAEFTEHIALLHVVRVEPFQARKRRGGNGR